MIEMPPPWNEEESGDPRDRIWNLYAQDLMSSERKRLASVVITEPSEWGGYDVHLSVSPEGAYEGVLELFPQVEWTPLGQGQATHFGGLYRER